MEEQYMNRNVSEKVDELAKLLSQVKGHVEALSPLDAGIVELFFDSKFSIPEISCVYELPPYKIKEVLSDFLARLLAKSARLQRFSLLRSEKTDFDVAGLRRQANTLIEKCGNQRSAAARLRELVGIGIRISMPVTPPRNVADEIRDMEQAELCFTDKKLQKVLKGIMAPDIERRRRAMEPFVRATFEIFIRYLYCYLGNEVECEEVLEDVYADIWESPGHLRDVTNDKQLLRTVYMCYMRKRLREVYRRAGRNLPYSQEGIGALVASCVEVMPQEEHREAFRRMLSRLKSREKRAVELWMNGMSIRAIASELKITVDSAKMLKWRAMVKLRKMLTDYVPKLRNL
jgi:RNA polymerase sigma factor (sigma-70 family)